MMKRITLALLFLLSGCLEVAKNKSSIDSEGFTGRIDPEKFDYYNSRAADGAIHKVIAYHRDLKQFFTSDTSHKVFQSIPPGQVKFLDAKQLTAARLEVARGTPATAEGPPANSFGQRTWGNAASLSPAGALADERGPEVRLYVTQRMEETLPEIPEKTAAADRSPASDSAAATSPGQAYTLLVCVKLDNSQSESVAISLKEGVYFASYMKSRDTYFEVEPTGSGYVSARDSFSLTLDPSSTGLSIRGTLLEGQAPSPVKCYGQGSGGNS